MEIKAFWISKKDATFWESAKCGLIANIKEDIKRQNKLIILEFISPYITGIVLILFILSSSISLMSAKLLAANNDSAQGK